VKESKKIKCGYVTLVGRPNVGKSTLINRLLNFKLSIVSHKPQTTRKNILGILNGKDYQILFTDTPGLLQPKYGLQKVMAQSIETALKDADLTLFLIDDSCSPRDFNEIKELMLSLVQPVILVINKIDLIKKQDLLHTMNLFRNIYPFQSIVPISALKNDGIDLLLNEILKELPENFPYFPEDYISDRDERFFVAEMIREKIFMFFSKEIPYSTHVEIELFKENKQNKTIIQAIIYVEKSSQKGILIGKNGMALKRIGERARRDIENFLNQPVFLELYVKVLSDWRKQERRLRQLGY
jgi:GTP-binding protein Era